MPCSWIKDKCIQCGMPRNDKFYDKSGSRPLCSKQCYYDWFDNLPHKSVQSDCFNKNHRPVYQFPKQGRVTGLSSFNFNESILGKVF